MKAVKSNELSVLDRFGLVNDYNALFKSGTISVADFLDVFRAFATEMEYAVWVSLDTGLSQISQMINNSENEKLKENFNQLVIEILLPIAQKVGKYPVNGEGLFFFKGKDI